tara:strand:- start:75 stop:254 length:180 start_codon:yes stop_codon:yes gene_type:complete
MQIRDLQNIIYTLFEQAKLDNSGESDTYDQAYKQISNILSGKQWADKEAQRELYERRGL